MKWPGPKKKSIWFETLGYVPTASQLPIHQSRARHLLIGGGWRGGKSRATAMEALGCWPSWGLLYIVGNRYENCLAEFDYLEAGFRMLADRTGSKLISRRTRPPAGQSRCSLELLGGQKRVVTISTRQDGPQSITARGEAPHIILLVEFEALDYSIYLAARGRLAETRGRLILSGTFPDDTGWQAQLWERWKGDNAEDGASFSLATWENLRVFPGGWDDPEIKALRATYPEAELMRKFGAQPQKPATLVFPEFDYALHVKDFVQYERKLPVEVWIDPGYGESAYAVLAVQVVGSWVFVVDEVYEHGLIGPEVIELCKQRDWWDDVTGGVIDVAGRQHHAARSQIEVWRGEADVNLRSQTVALAVGRERLKSFLMKQPETNEPRILFSPRCKNACAEFGKYVWRHAPEERAAGEEPIDRYCDAIKALSYGLVDRFGVVEYPPLTISDAGPREQVWQRIFKQGVVRA